MTQVGSRGQHSRRTQAPPHSQAAVRCQGRDRWRACRAAKRFTSNIPNAAKAFMPNSVVMAANSHIPTIVNALCTNVSAYTCARGSTQVI